MSFLRIKASRRNGARSRGPKTPAGKSRSSANAIRHGLLAKCVVLGNESQENFQDLLGRYLDKFAPLDGVEFGMIEEMIASYWRLRRAMAIERYLFDQALDRPSGRRRPLPPGPGLVRTRRFPRTAKPASLPGHFAQNASAGAVQPPSAP